MDKSKIIGSATAENNGGIYKTTITAGDHSYVADEPIDFGGEATGPSPTDYLCMSLASCKAITIRMYAKRKGWKLDKVNVKATFVKGDQAVSGNSSFFCSVNMSGELNEEQRKRMLQISKACPVDRLLSRANEVVTVME